MNRRQFSQSIAALFAAPALPTAALATPVAQTAVPSMAYCWADYLTRMHKVCSPQMLAPFLRIDQSTAKLIHAQLIAENYLTASGAAHPNLVARQPKSIPHAASKTVEPKQQAKRTNTTNTPQPHEQPRNAVQDDIPALAEIWEQNSDQPCEDINTYLHTELANTIVIGAIGAPVGFYIHNGTSICHLFAQTADAETTLRDHANATVLGDQSPHTLSDQEPML
ncbi:hypothetical protein GCM10008927_17410 [Amylibacter ulvae]|uniref:Uncharacterized protein n=1 Tax=Paramylibacter ulvae TaxID=1651968 RepID=A0ABQ3D0E9_9RHOB|nr:hypothetical protein [Amylibacter ulvae]GHA52461.1 hypothetical protein GCM10008927_17410 [Amylibacter ulvae]